jgi:hypothetical protein
MNMYAYAADNPVNMIDPWGLAAWDVTKDCWDANAWARYRSYAASRAEEHQ